MSLIPQLGAVPSEFIAAFPPQFHFLEGDYRLAYFQSQVEAALKRGGLLVTLKNSGALIEPSPFDSRCLGRSMGKLTWAWAYPEESDRLAEAVLTKAQREGLDHLVVRIEADHLQLVQAFTRWGFYLVDTQVTLQHPIPPTQTEQSYKNIEINLFRSRDIDRIQEMSAHIFELSRYYADPKLPGAAVDKLHRQWVKNDCSGRADVVLTARDGGEIIGYIACLFQQAEPSFDLPPIANIDLIAVEPKTHGTGAGTALVKAALQHYQEKASLMTVETQGHNNPALNLYFKCGFRWRFLALTLHWSGSTE